MSLRECFRRAARMGVINDAEAAELTRRYDEIAAETVDAAQARARMQREIETEAALREQAALLTEVARGRVIDGLVNYRDHNGRQNMLAAWLDTFENFGRRGSFIQDAESKRLAIFNQAQAELRDAMRELQRGAILGDLGRTSRLGSQRRRVLMANLAREAFGEATTDPAAAAMAQAWHRVADQLRERFNAAGGNIGRLEGWGFPQTHNAEALLAIGQAAWVEHMMQIGVLDRDRTVHPVSGQRMTDTEMRRALAHIWDQITTDGYQTRDVNDTPAGRGALYTQHADHRFLHFASADAWMEYAERFGGGRDLFATMMGHVSKMARDIAHMETFGPNPQLLQTFVGNWLRAEATRNPEALGPGITRATAQNAINATLARADAMWRLQRGETPTDSTVAHVMSSVRNFISATSLGGVWISSLTDPASGQDARMRIGMGFARAGFAQIMARTLADMVSSGRREDAIDAMLGLDSAQNILRRQSAEIRGIDHRFWSAWLTDRTLTWGLLSPWTQAGKHLAGLDIMRHFGEQVGHDWAALSRLTRETLQTHGFDAASWDAIRSVPRADPHRLRPPDVLGTVERELGERYLQMILREVRYAVPEATVRSRSLVTGDAPAGSLIGEAARSAAQFKGFALAVYSLKLQMVARDIVSRDPTRMGIGAAFIITSTMLGALAMALKDVRDGRDPRKWLDERTWLDWQHWGAAFLQAGGLGIYGDFLASETNRFGGGLEGTVAGPLVGRASDIMSVIPEIKAGMRGEKTNFTGYAAKLARRNVPFVNHWATSRLYQSAVVDKLQIMADPTAAAAFRRAEAKKRRETGQSYYWPAGSVLPQRAPDFTRILQSR